MYCAIFFACAQLLLLQGKRREICKKGMSQIETLHPQKEIGVVPLLQYFTTEAIQKQQHCIEQHAGNSLPGNLFYTRHGDFQKYCKKKKASQWHGWSRGMSLCEDSYYTFTSLCQNKLNKYFHQDPSLFFGKHKCRKWLFILYTITTLQELHFMRNMPALITWVL